MIVYDTTVRDRYARALFNVSKNAGIVTEVTEDSISLLQAFQGKVKTLLESPGLSRDRKAEFMNRVLSGRVQRILEELINLLLKKGRSEYIRPVLESFIRIAEEDQGIYEADLTSATELTDEERERLTKSLEKFASSQLKINWHVDPSLIGGIKFTYGDVMIDDSLKGKLNRMKSQLEAAASVP